MIERVYKLTKLGRKRAGSTADSKRDPLLDHLYSSPGRSASTTELSQVTGMTEGTVLVELKKLARSGYVLDMSSEYF